MHQKLNRISYRGRSFRGKDLIGYDFSFADIRGTDFSNAILTNANFTHAQAGLKKQWVVILNLGIVIVSILAGSLSAYAGAAVSDFLLSKPPEQITVSPGAIVGPTVFVFFVFAVVLAIIIHRGLGGDLAKFAVITATIVGVLVALPGTDISRTIILFDLVIISIGIAGSLLGALALTISIFLFGFFSIIFLALCITFGAFLSTWETISFYLKIGGSWGEFLIVACLISIPLIGLSFYIGWKSVTEDKKYLSVRSIAINLCSLGGTNFRGANLIEADFSQATLPYTDFRKASLKQVSWFQVSKLEFSRVKGTYLEDGSIRHLVVSREKQDEVYDDKNLRGLNLKFANLSDSSFVGADLSEANLEGANLTRAKLVKTKLYSTNLSRTCLTGACIQDWAISTDTQFDQINCLYVYMRLPTQDDPDPWRKPDNRNETFQEGDFADFIAPIIKTLDLYRQQNLDPRRIASKLKSLDFYHYGGIDPAAAAIALQQLAEENPEAGLEIVALEGRGEEKIRLQAAITGVSDSSQLNARYFEKYHKIASLPYHDIQTLLASAAEKNERIRSLERLLENALQQPKFYVETYQNKGEFIMSQSKGNVNISNVQGDVSGIAAAGENQTMTGVAMGTISGSVTNTINQLPPSPDPEKPGLKELLAQLQVAIEAESELPDEDKAEALEQVKTLAEAGQKPEDNLLQKAAKTSIKILKGTIASLPDAAKLAESCVKLLPAIATLLALV